MKKREYHSIGPDLPAPYRSVNLMQVLPDFFMDLHSHPFYHLNYLLEGSLSVRTEGKEYAISDGCIFVLPPHIPHALYSATGYLQIGTDILPTQQADISREISRLCPSFVSMQLPPMTTPAEKVAEQMRYLLSSPMLTDNLRAVHIAEERLLALLERLQSKKEDLFTEAFAKMLAHHEPWTLSLADMCRYLSLSRTQLERQAHIAFGCGAAAYCARLRYHQICHALHGEETLETIAARFGFYDTAHLCRFFQARAGVTPGQYRKNLQ